MVLRIEPQKSLGYMTLRYNEDGTITIKHQLGIDPFDEGYYMVGRTMFRMKDEDTEPHIKKRCFEVYKM